MFKKFMIATATAALMGTTAMAQMSQTPEQTDGDAAETANLSTILDTESAMVEGNRIVGINVTKPEAGYVAIHDDGAGAPPANIGFLPVAAGESANLSIELTAEPTGNIIVMLHDETNDNDTYDFGPGSTDVDTPTMSATGEAVVSPVPAQ